jgi:hypothetical protein
VDVVALDLFTSSLLPSPISGVSVGGMLTVHSLKADGVEEKQGQGGVKERGEKRRHVFKR